MAQKYIKTLNSQTLAKIHNEQKQSVPFAQGIRNPPLDHKVKVQTQSWPYNKK